VTGNDITWPQVTGSDPEVTSFDRKSPWSGCRSPKTGVYCTFHFLQGCSSQEETVTWQEMTSRDFRWPELTWKWRHLTRSHLEVAVEGLKLAYTVQFTSYKAVAPEGGSHVTGNDVTWPHLTGSDPEVTSFDRKSREVAVVGRKLAYTVNFASYKAVARRRRQSRDGKWRHVTSGDRKWRHLTGSHLEVAVEGLKLAYTVHFTSYKAVARRRRQSRDRKWRDVTCDRKWPESDVTWPEVTWKWV